LRSEATFSGWRTGSRWQINRYGVGTKLYGTSASMETTLLNATLRQENVASVPEGILTTLARSNYTFRIQNALSGEARGVRFVVLETDKQLYDNELDYSLFVDALHHPELEPVLATLVDVAAHKTFASPLPALNREGLFK
jgi:hypothetical protein